MASSEASTSCQSSAKVSAAAAAITGSTSAAATLRSARDCVANGIDDDGNGVIDDCVGIDTANNDADPRDDAGHGTHVSGTIGALGNNGVGVAGQRGSAPAALR